MDLWPVRCAPVGSVAVGSVLWRYRGELRCTAIVKATFAMPESGEMTRINPQPIRRSDDYLHGLPSLAGAAEIAPRLQEAGAVVVGHAYAPEPDGVKKRSIRFTVVRQNKLLIDKTLYVYGDRVKGGAPKRFKKMPLGYERALGGIDFSRNPIGVGMDKGTKARPNVINPRDPKRAVGGYGPIPARFPRRKRKLGAVKPQDLESGLLELPDDFNWDYFQPAPRDQRIKRIRGDEWLMLEGMHPRYPRVRVRIPKARAVARIYQVKHVDVPAELDLQCDTLHLEPDYDRCSLVFRGDFPVASELAASAIVIAGAVLEGPEPIHWPATVEELDAIASPVQRGKPLVERKSDPLFATAPSPGVVVPEGAKRAPPPPPRRQQRTPPPPMPPPSVPPPPAWHHVARHSSSGFAAVKEPPSGFDARGLPHPAAEGVGSAAQPSYPGMPAHAPSHPHPAPAWSSAAPNQQPGGLYQSNVRPPDTAMTPTGTIPAPPLEDDERGGFVPRETTDEIEGEEEDENPYERTDPMAEEEEDESEWTRTEVLDLDEEPG
jgi:hypothetical protein